MTPEAVIDILGKALIMAGTVAGPAILFGLVAGVGVSIFQATTQINDFTLVFVPKVLATILALILFGSWMLDSYLSFTRELIINLPNGMMVGFSGNNICFCEPFFPHAWPIRYRLTTNFDIVSLGAFVFIPTLFGESAPTARSHFVHAAALQDVAKQGVIWSGMA